MKEILKLMAITVICAINIVAGFILATEFESIVIGILMVEAATIAFLYFIFKPIYKNEKKD